MLKTECAFLFLKNFLASQHKENFHFCKAKKHVISAQWMQVLEMEKLNISLIIYSQMKLCGTVSSMA